MRIYLYIYINIHVHMCEFIYAYICTHIYHIPKKPQRQTLIKIWLPTHNTVNLQVLAPAWKTVRTAELLSLGNLSRPQYLKAGGELLDLLQAIALHVYSVTLASDMWLCHKKRHGPAATTRSYSKSYSEALLCAQGARDAYGSGRKSSEDREAEPHKGFTHQSSHKSHTRVQLQAEELRRGGAIEHPQIHGNGIPQHELQV